MSPQDPRDESTKSIYLKHGLGEAPTMEALKAVAMQLLADEHTALEGAQVVLGRQVSPDSPADEHVRDIAYNLGPTQTNIAFAVLKGRRAAEELAH
jgi:hypothetical protein